MRVAGVARPRRVQGTGLPALDARLAAQRRCRAAIAANAAAERQGFRRVSKQVTNQGTGVVFRSDDLDRNGTPDATGILAGDRHEHHYWGGTGVSPVNRRLVETTNHVVDGQSVYSYANSAVLNEFVYGRVGRASRPPAASTSP